MPKANSTNEDNASGLFYSQPILNSPYEAPARHWELDESGQPTQKILNYRRPASFITPVPLPKKGDVQATLPISKKADQISAPDQEYQIARINEIRSHVTAWRNLPKNKWRVTPVSARLLEYWRTHKFSGIRPYFCQLEAVETAIWLTEVAPFDKKLQQYAEHLASAAEAANPGLMRLALKMATGAGKTTVMAMLILWQALNAIHTARPRKGLSFSLGFLIVAPGLTIRDRLRVLHPNDPDSLYAAAELAPPDMLASLNRARIVITNYHAFRRREKMTVAKGTRAALEGWRGKRLETAETESEMLKRVLPELTGLKNIIVINDEAHHCYREKPGAAGNLADSLKGLAANDRREAAKEAGERREAARLWISGLEAVNRHLGVAQVFDLSATPFFLAGSGYAEGTLFPWTMSDFSLMDAIESGLVKLPRLPVSDNIPGNQAPMFRKLWETIRKDMTTVCKKADPLALPAQLQTALDALYGHYSDIFDIWKKAGMAVPPCFIIVCNNTTTSRLVYEYISGFWRETENGGKNFTQGRLPLLRNYDDSGEAFARPRTLLIDSRQLESGEALEKDFAEAAREEIARFRREIISRGGKLAEDLKAGRDIPEAAILREVLNTVGKPGQLGQDIRCVVSVGMLTEGWDANNVTHILGVRAFGSQLLCEQVIGRALRRQSHELNDDGLFAVEYADILGIPFDFAAKPVIVKPKQPEPMTQVMAVRPERDHLEITFPRVMGFRKVLSGDRLKASFSEESRFVLTQELTGATDTRNSGIIGEFVDLNLKYLDRVRENTLVMHLTKHLLERFRDGDGIIRHYLYGQLKAITREWLHKYLVCEGGTYPGQLLYKALADRACEKMAAAIESAGPDADQIQIVLDPAMPQGSTRHVNFRTSRKKEELWQTDSRKCHINFAVTDSSWEAEVCRYAEKRDNHILAYAKNFNPGLEVPYTLGGESRIYIPDFILKIDDGGEEPINLIVEVKGQPGEESARKKETMQRYWIPGVNANGGFGRWDFLEIDGYNAIARDLEDYIARARRKNGK